MNNEFNFNGNIENAIIGSTINAETFIQNQSTNKSNGKLKDELLADIVDKAKRMLERKEVIKLEDLHNDDFRHFLQDKGYITSDQTRSGFSGINPGELDIMIRSDKGSPVSILEAFRLSSCGLDNKVVVSHIDKLLHNYDMVGLLRNFIIVYAEASDFSKLWENYKIYIKDINQNSFFQKKVMLKSFDDTGVTISDSTDVRVGKAIHSREGVDIEVFHVFMNMMKNSSNKNISIPT